MLFTISIIGLLLFTISIIGLLLLIWFRTDAWLEYCRLFGLDSISFFRDFDNKQYQDVLLTYHIYLRRYHNCFFVRLITCPVCLAVWLGIIAGVIKAIFAFFILVLTGHGILSASILAVVGVAINLPIIILGGLLIFVVIDRLLG